MKHKRVTCVTMDNSLIRIINKLQDAFVTVGVANPIDLPQVFSFFTYIYYSLYYQVTSITFIHLLTCRLRLLVVSPPESHQSWKTLLGEISYPEVIPINTVYTIIDKVYTVTTY